MRKCFTPVLIGVGLLSPGCSFICNMAYNIKQEPKDAIRQKVILKRHERLGAVAWDEMVAQYGCQFSDDYRQGFIDGFADYLTYGGIVTDGTYDVPVVPAVPPPRY